MFERKQDRIRAAWANGDCIGALKIVALYHGPKAADFRTCWAAHINPTFYRQLKKDPDALVAKALAALEREFIAPEQE
jgi:hypothetical protein